MFACLGALLEALHAWKSASYLGLGNETRRLMWTLAHAHGVGLGLIHIAYAATLGLLANVLRPTRLQLASVLLRWATVLLPGGFFLGGVFTYEGDPGILVILAPLGAACLGIFLLLVVVELTRRKR